MDLMIDNTSFHSFGRCLAGKAKNPDSDLLGFLNFIVEFVFSSNLLISEFEHTEPMVTTEMFLDLLQTMGVGTLAVRVNELSDVAFEEAVCNTQRKLALNLDGFLPSSDLSIAVGWSEIGKTNQEYMTEFDHFLRRVKEAQDPTEELERLEFRRSLDAVKYVLLKDTRLLEGIAARMESGSEWGVSWSGQLDMTVRYLLNESLAPFHKSLYAPAVERADLLRSRNSRIVDIVDKVLSGRINEDIVPDTDSFRETILSGVKFPSILIHLVDMSKGDLKTLLLGAMELKEEMTEVRSVLDRHIENMNSGKPGPRADSEAELQELSGIVFERVWRKRPCSVLESIDMALFPPLPSVNLGGVASYFQDLWRARKISVLTDISCKASMKDLRDNTTPGYLRELRAQCVKNLKSNNKGRE